MLVALKALEKGRDDRYQSAKELADELASWLKGGRISTEERGPIGRLVRGAKRHRAVVGVLVALVAIAAGGIVLAQLGHRSDDDSRREQKRAAIAAADAALDAFSRPGPLQDQREKLERARDDLRTAASDDPELAERLRALEGAVFAARGLEPGDTSLDALEASLRCALARAKDRDEVRAALVQALEKKGSPEAALAVLEEARSPSPALLERLGKLRFELDDLPGAREALERAIKAEAARASARLLLVRVLARSIDSQEALDLAQKIESERGRDDETTLALSEALLATDPGRAVHALRQVEARALRGTEPRDAQALARIGAILVDAGRFQEALLPLDRAVEIAKRDPLPLLVRADAKLYSGDAAGAVLDLSLAADRAGAGTFLRARARAREVFVRAIDDDASAPALLAKALDERPKDPGLQLLSLVLFAKNDDEKRRDEEKLASLARALGRRREAAHAWAALARWRADRKDRAGAQETARRSMEIRPSAEALSALADSLAASPEATREEKLAALARADEAFLSGDSDGALLVRESRVAVKLAKRFPTSGELLRAWKAAQRAGNAAPWAGGPWLQQAKVIVESQGKLAGQPGALRFLVEHGLELSGEDPKGLELLATLELEAAAKEPARVRELAAKAEDLTSRSLARKPDDPRTLAVRGYARVLLGKAQDALADLDLSVRVFKYDAQAWAWKAAAHKALGQQDLAARAENEARDRGPRKDQLIAEYGARAEKIWDETDAIAGDRGPLLEALRHVVDLEPSQPGANYLLGYTLFSHSGAREEGEDQWVFMGRALARGPHSLDRLDQGTIALLDNVSSTTEENIARFEGDWERTRSFESLWTAATIRSLNLLRHAGAEQRRETDPLRLEIERCLCQDPAEAFAAHGPLAWLWALDAEPALARFHGERFLSLFPKNGHLCLAMALAEAQANHGDRARRWLEEAYGFAPPLKAVAAKYPALNALR
ncbi:hypothetical protein HY251_15870 [bacterium]|nr:hypothetical protein [bacterium]